MTFPLTQAPPTTPAADGLAEHVFIGRQQELDVLAALMAAAAVGLGAARLALIEAEPGLGKSALICEFLARHRGVPTVAASGDAAERALPYGLVRQLASDAAGVIPASCPLLAAGPPADADPLAVGAELQALLAARPRAGGLAVIIEDLHWADPQSAGALLFACRRLAGGQALVIASGRPLELGRLGDGWARFLHAERYCNRLTLAGFDRSELAELAAALGRGGVGGSALGHVADVCGGSPLLARALLSELPDHVLRGPRSELTVPGSLAAVILPRLAALRADARDLVIAAAVLGECSARGGRAPGGAVPGGAARSGALGHAAPDDAADDGVGLDDAALLAGVPLVDDALDLAVQGGFLVAEAAHRRIRFANELIRRAVYGDIGTAMRRSLHRWAATLTDGPDALGHRAAAASGPDVQLALELDAAADAASAAVAVGHGASSRAAGYLVQAAELGARGPERASRVLAAFELLVRTADAAGAASLRPLVEQLPAGARRDAALGQLAMLTARPVQAEALLLAAWAAGRQPAGRDDAAAAEAAAGLAVLYANAGSLDDAGKWARRSMLAVRDDQRGYPAILAMQATARALAGDTAAAARMLSCLPAAAPLVPLAQSDSLAARGLVRLAAGDAPAAADDLAAVATRIRAYLPLRYPGQALAHLAEAEFRLGQWDEAQQHAELAISMARDADRASDLPLAYCAGTQVAALRGQWARASAYVLGAQEAAAAFGAGSALTYAAAARSCLGFARDDPDEVLSATARLLTMPGAAACDYPAAIRWRPLRVWALIRVGALEAAEPALAELDGGAAAGGALQPYAAWLRAGLALARDEPAAAWHVLENRGTRAGRPPDRFADALLEVAAGRCLARLHKRPAALHRLRAGFQILTDLRARPLAEQAEAELAALGMRVRADADRCVPDLTPQELQVARLVGDGMSNREAAGVLYLSPKTIEYHLAHIFAKLGVHTRYQLAARLRSAEPA